MTDSDSYGPGKECAYVDWLGEDVEKLKQYVKVYGKSLHLWHQAGVAYAKEIIKRLTGQ